MFIDRMHDIVVSSSVKASSLPKWRVWAQKAAQKRFDRKRIFYNIILPTLIDSREALYGGRTNDTKLYHKFSNGEQVHCVDVCNLYLFICKYGRFPVGHPTVITENCANLNNREKPYEGLIKCKVLPPTNLLHPVSPFWANNKLMFPLCATCARMKKKFFRYDKEERALVGTWVNLELYKAIESDYRVQDIYELWHYN